MHACQWRGLHREKVTRARWGRLHPSWTVRFPTYLLQGRLQRCVQRCQDKAQEALSTSPTPKEIEKAQVGGWGRCGWAGCSSAALPCYPAPASVDVPAGLRPSPMQGLLANCAADCAQEYEKQVPKLKGDLVARFKQLQK